MTLGRCSNNTNYSNTREHDPDNLSGNYRSNNTNYSNTREPIMFL